MERKNDSKQNKNSESEGRGIPPPPRRNPGVKMSPKVVSPSFRFAALNTRPPAAAGFMSPSTYSSKPFSPPSDTANIRARFDEDHDDGPTRSVAVAPAVPLKPFTVSKEHVGSSQFFQLPKTAPAKASSQTISVLDLKQEAKPRKSACWNSPTISKLPRYFPLERTNRRINLEECSFNELLSRLSEGFRIMSIQAKYFNRPASAALLTTENVELYLVLWESDDCKEVIVEVQRRRGDTTIFHHHANHIMDAASGTFDDSIFTHNEGSLLYLQSTEKLLRSELSRIAPECDMDKEAVVALEIVYDLLKKDRRDARQLGIEGVCIMTNARKTVLPAAILTSRAILLGNQTQASQGLHDIILGIIQKRSIGEDEVMGGEDPYDSDDEQYFVDEDEEMAGYSPEYKEEMMLLFNLALVALSHALEVVTTFGIDPPSSPEASISAAWVIDTFLVQGRKLSDTDLLTTLLQTLQRAYHKPHNAWLAAKCLRFICTASSSAAKRTVNLGGPKFVANAYEIGVSSHAKLESECLHLQSVLMTC